MTEAERPQSRNSASKMVTCPGCKNRVRYDAPACLDPRRSIGYGCPLHAKGAGEALLAAQQEPWIAQQFREISEATDNEEYVYESGFVEKLLELERRVRASILSERGALSLILAEVESARQKHPNWPANDTLFAAAIVSEESGELMRAAVQHKGEGGSLDACDKEAIQTAAVAIRFLERR